MTDPAPPNLLSEASPTSLEEFLSRAPYNLSDAELTHMVSLYREQRKAWLQDEANGKRRASKLPKGSQTTMKLGDLDLSTLR